MLVQGFFFSSVHGLLNKKEEKIKPHLISRNKTSNPTFGDTISESRVTTRVTMNLIAMSLGKQQALAGLHLKACEKTSSRIMLEILVCLGQVWHRLSGVAVFVLFVLQETHRSLGAGIKQQKRDQETMIVYT